MAEEKMDRAVFTFLGIEDGILVFAKRSPTRKREPNYDGVFAGRVEGREGVVDAAGRELDEESGVTSSPVELGHGWLGRMITHSRTTEPPGVVPQISNIFFVGRRGMTKDRLIMSKEHTEFHLADIKTLEELVRRSRGRKYRDRIGEGLPGLETMIDLTNPTREILTAPPDPVTLDPKGATICTKLVGRLQAMRRTELNRAKTKSF